MKIILLNQFYAPDTAATGQLLADVAEALAHDGHEAHVVCSRGAYSGGTTEDGGRRKEAGSLRVHRVKATGFGRDQGWRRMADWASFYVSALAQSLKLGRCDVCLALTTPPFIAVVAIILKKLFGCKAIVWTMDLWPDVAEELGHIRKRGAVSRLLRGIAGWIYRHADAIISLGQYMTERLKLTGADPARIVQAHNWAVSEGGKREATDGGTTDIQHPTSNIEPVEDGLVPAKRISHRTPNTFTVMYSGNMGAPHEFDTILEAAELLKDESSIEFLFVGDGSRKAEVVAEVKKRALNNARFMPFRPLAELSESLVSADLHLMSMRSGVEGCIVPSKIYGILAAGRPAVLVGSTENEVAMLLADSGAGLTVACGNGAELAGHIRRLRDDVALADKMGQAGRRYYEAHLGRERSVRRIVEVITRGAEG